MTTKQANDLADWVESKGKNLTTIYITHGHGDHWFGAGTLRERFPEARLVATPSSVEVMKVNASPKFLDGAWKVGVVGYFHFETAAKRGILGVCQSACAS